MASCYPGFDLAPPAPPTRNAPAPHKDYTRPLHVDCSVEYELPNQAKPPEGARSEPLLMIHPCYYRRAESQRRSPFINNLPTRTQSMVTVGGRRASQVPRLVQQQQQQTAVSIQQPQHQTQQYQVQAVRYLDPSGRPEATTMLHQHQQQQHHQHMAVTNWNQMDASLVAAPAPVPVYSKPSVAAVKHMKRDPMLCRGGDFSSGSDSGVSVSAGHWTDSDRSPLAPELRLQRDFTATTDSGIGTPVDDKAVLSAVELNMTSALANYATEAVPLSETLYAVSATHSRCGSLPGKVVPRPNNVITVDCYCGLEQIFVGRPLGPLSHVLEQSVLVALETGRCSGKSHPINDTTYRSAPCPIVAHLAKTPHGAHHGPEESPGTLRLPRPALLEHDPKTHRTTKTHLKRSRRPLRSPCKGCYRSSRFRYPDETYLDDHTFFLLGSFEKEMSLDIPLQGTHLFTFLPDEDPFTCGDVRALIHSTTLPYPLSHEDGLMPRIERKAILP
uniref:Uncharacterized protein n=1 Tax=Timema douglasi TaxID=61478 RepID=A0A7R8VFV8_TIMDO|nr:unnamed protein product [Timema douglasi]